MPHHAVPDAPAQNLSKEELSCSNYNSGVDVFDTSVSTVEDASISAQNVPLPHSGELNTVISPQLSNNRTDLQISASQIPDTPLNKTVHQKFECVKSWSLNTLKYTRQIIEEKLGTTVPTRDNMLDLRIEAIKQLKGQYKLLLNNLQQFSACLSRTIEVQRRLTVQLASLGQQQLELAEGFSLNSDTHRSLVLNGEKLLVALDVVCQSIRTLVRCTFDDTMQTIKSMNFARIEYDADRKEYEALQAAASKQKQSTPSFDRRVDQVLARLHLSGQTFAHLKTAVDTKLRLLHENRVRVMQHNLLLLHRSTTAYFSGDARKLDETMRLFCIRTLSPAWNDTLHSDSVCVQPAEPQSLSKSPISPNQNGEQTPVTAITNGIH